jgi:oxepin-CoA hydrolase/3-oxo-5,6-dehydrosuberyl-CoA semialdehyde dehydrogenase
MNISVDTAGRKNLKSLLLSLDPAAKPLWGKMSPQQMVEHMVRQIEFSNGKRVTTCDLPAEEAAIAKEKWIYTDAQIPRNLALGPLPANIYPDIKAAIKQLMKELEDFDEYFEEPDTTAIHAGYGAMEYNEWLIWHGKHFTHHLKQFGLLQ